MSRNALIAFSLATALAASPASAFAPAPSRTINIADLDLGNPRDVSRLRRRIASALEQVCGSYATSESWQESEITRCRAEARSRADERLALLLGRSVQVADAGVAPRPR